MQDPDFLFGPVRMPCLDERDRNLKLIMKAPYKCNFKMNWILHLSHMKQINSPNA